MGVGLKGKTDASAKPEQEETPDKDRRDGYGNKTASAGRRDRRILIADMIDNIE